MPRLTFLPDGKTIDVRPGTTVLAAARQAGVGVRTRCGGVAGCLMCKVKVLEPDRVSPPTESERRKMGDAVDGERLACQTKAAGDATIVVPEDPLKAAVRRQLERQKEDDALW
ncbi:2Fe-2S iron-sulfur cluster-binding protein [Paenibacillus sp.]|uniref:2Fe-2S iron-sulfur cluster-binding protein n=1 Tax=Paenibacillus sp. TaxID=58172 RepID=UPI002D368187|nr:2Fe-2S iron-sulfur cluster-binding protein [Paenibacillus sp.]HZG57475.1 2Fe-2S iron-sulfur cluster-binding protein [Paenibacillus sp.]